MCVSVQEIVYYFIQKLAAEDILVDPILNSSNLEWQYFVRLDIRQTWLNVINWMYDFDNFKCLYNVPNFATSRCVIC